MVWIVSWKERPEAGEWWRERFGGSGGGIV